MMEQYNFDMSAVRVSVEWLFGDIINDFKFLDFKKNLKIGMSCSGQLLLAEIITRIRPGRKTFTSLKLEHLTKHRISTF